MAHRNNNRSFQRAIHARLNHDDYVDSLRENRFQRSNVFRPGRGKGAYRRKNKYPNQWGTSDSE